MVISFLTQPRMGENFIVASPESIGQSLENFIEYVVHNATLTVPWGLVGNWKGVISSIYNYCLEIMKREIPEASFYF